MLDMCIYAYSYFDDHEALDGSLDDVHLDVRLEKLPEITGSVRLPGGGIPPINSFLTQSVLVNGTWQEGYPQIRTDGSYSAPAYPGVSYRLCTGGIEMGVLVQCFDHIDQTDQGADFAFSPIVLQPHEVRKGTDFDLVEGGSVSGRLIDGHASAPLRHYSANLRFTDPSGGFLALVTITTDEDGYYRATGLPNGSFNLQLIYLGPFTEFAQTYPGIPCSLDCDPTHGQLLTVDHLDEVGNIDFTVLPAALIHGRIFDPATGAGIEGATVETYTQHSDGIWFYYAIEWSTLSLADGSYELYSSGGAAGYLHYLAAEGAAPYINAVYPDTQCAITANCVPNANPIAVHAGETIENADIPMTLGAVISGRIVDRATDGGLTGLVYFYGQGGQSVTEAQSRAEEGYTTYAIPAGTYFAKATEYGHFVCGVYQDKECPRGLDPVTSTDPTPIVLKPGEIRKLLNIRLDMNSLFDDGFDTSVVDPARPATRDR